ncbi:MAG: hypothetical protein JXA73_23725 [Acidobacteria bacterium]|nr:hypothetical protein [Acidobacteriota bacterium]
MIKSSCISVVAVILCLGICIVQQDMAIGQDKLPATAELTIKHIHSIGRPAEVAKVKSRGISGKAQVSFVQGAKGQITDGQFLCVSEGQKMGLQMKFGDVNYPGEYFAYNGTEATVGHISPGQKSPIADFLYRYNGIMKEGFLGGVFSVAWPLLREEAKQLNFQISQEKIGDKQYYVADYSSQKTLGDVKIKLFFDAKNFRHVRSEYRVRHANDASSMPSVSGGSGPGSINQGATLSKPMDRAPRATIQESQADSIYLLVEKFDNFANIGGLVLPQDYSIEYSVEGTGTSFIAKWVVLAEHWMSNRPVDQSFFVAQK